MRLALATLSLLVLAVVTFQAMRLSGGSEVRWSPYCLAAQFFFNAICLASAAKLGWSSKIYAEAFYGLMAVVIVTAAVFAVNSASNFPASGMGSAVMIASLTFVCLVCCSFAASLSRIGMLNRFSLAHVFCSGAFLACGIVTLASLAFPSDIVSDVLRAAFGINWLAQGIYGLSEAGLYLRGRAEAVHFISATPVLIIIVVFCALSIFLSGRQAELSRENPIVEARGILAGR